MSAIESDNFANGLKMKTDVAFDVLLIGKSSISKGHILILSMIWWFRAENFDVSCKIYFWIKINEWNEIWT